MAVNDQIIARIQKLLALAGNNSNEHEAAAAAAKAQALMQEHDLAMADVESVAVDPRTAGIHKDDSDIEVAERGKPNWKKALYRAVAQTSDCWFYTRSRTIEAPTGKGRRWRYKTIETGTFIGRKQDIEMAQYVGSFLTRELERLQQEFGRTRWDELREYAREQGISTHDAERDFSALGRHPLRAKDSWIRGAVEAVVLDLHEAKLGRDRASAAAGALVVRKEAAIRDWWAQQRGFADYDAYLEKQRASAVAVAPEKKLTKRDIERMERAAEREWARQERARDRQYARTDWQAYNAGREAGAALNVRPGVKGGETRPAPRQIH